ncbi:type II toxin-antitoxin system HicB family antitoxin [Candidimonas humi]|uniref:Type II toxin-antitoxin system HicB family antitoxin n=1 Tax=Candidimonas humi TaxID=683355 RepID=A0ABV8NXX5_9BURK|nr:type II toxin-antitoxin system HicB family antitoxin [Candidimonas humi]
MNNVMTINGHPAVISFDPELNMFRGEFVTLNGSADFYASDIAGLKREARISLDTFMDLCKEKGIEPHKRFSGKFILRVPPDTHEAAALAAQASGKSLNQWVGMLIEQAIHT